MPYSDWKPKIDGKDTRIEAMTIETPNETLRLDEAIELTVNLKVLGGLRNCLEQEAWEEAYNLGDKFIRVTYFIELNKSYAGILKTKIIKPHKIVRKATFYWSRNPDLPYKIWALISQENHNPIVPKDEEDTKSLMFDLKKTYHIMGSDLGKGDHKLSAKVRVKWPRHSFVDSGSASMTSNNLMISCL